MEPTLRQLEYVVAIADHGSFHAAARACHVSQPGLSSQVKQLEDQLEVQIFERVRPRVRTTPAGEAIVVRARHVLAEVEALRAVARAHHGPLVGRLRLGVIPTVAPYLLPRTLPAVRRRHPQLELELHEGQTAHLVEALHAARLDLLLLALDAPLGDLATLELFRDPFLLAVPTGHRLARRRRVRESDLEPESVLLLEDGHCLRDQALSVCHDSGAHELGDVRASSLPTLLQMVAGGLGITLLPSLAARVERVRDLVLVPFRAPAPSRSIGLAWRPTSPRAEEFELLARSLRPTEARPA